MDDRLRWSFGGHYGEAPARSKRNCQPKTERVPVPVRSDLSWPFSPAMAHQIEVGLHGDYNAGENETVILHARPTGKRPPFCLMQALAGNRPTSHFPAARRSAAPVRPDSVAPRQP